MKTLLLSLVIALVAQPPLLLMLRRAQVLDQPSHRSSHSVPTLRGGGVAVVVAVVTATAVAVARGVVDPVAIGPAMIVLLGLVALGLVEDVRGVSARCRLVGQLFAGCAAGAVAVAGGAPAWVALSTTVAVVVYANAFNFMDGVNGISAMNATFAGLAYAALGVRYDAPAVTVVGLAVAGGALGFLPFNFPSPRVFLGDSGSYALGGAVAVLVVQCRAAGAPLALCAAPVSIYLVDTGWTLLCRRLRGEQLMTAHRHHRYQRLADSALGHGGAAIVTVATAALITGVTYLGNSPSWAWVSAPTVVLTLVAYVWIPGLHILAPSSDSSASQGVPATAPVLLGPTVR